MALKLPGFLGKVFKILGKITDVLVKGRQAGLWNQQPAQKIQGFASPIDFEAGVRPATEPSFSMSAEVLKVSNGMPKTLAAFLSAFYPFLVASLAGFDFSLLLTNPRAAGAALLAVALTALSQYNQRPGQASVMLGSSSEVREEAETKTSLKLVVPIDPKGGK